MLVGQLVVVDAVDHGQVGAFARGGDDDLPGARGQVSRGLLLGGEDAGAFEHDVDAEILVRQLGRIADRGDLELLAGGGDHVAIDHHFVRELAVHAVVAEQVGIGFNGAEIVDGDDFDVGAAGLNDGTEDVAADAAKTVDGDADCHVLTLLKEKLGGRARVSYNCAVTASTTALGVMPKCS